MMCRCCRMPRRCRWPRIFTQISKGHSALQPALPASAPLSPAASSASRAGLVRSGQGACHPATGRGDKGADPLLFAECSVGGGAAQLHCAGALGHCEPAALDAGCSLQRSSGAKPKGALRRELVLAAAAGAVGIGQGSMRGKLKRAGWDDSFLINILSQFTKIHMR